MRNAYLVAALLTVAGTASADAIRQTKGDFYDAFRRTIV